MRADRKWLVRNLGYDPIENPPPQTKRAQGVQDIQREIIEFDSESHAGLKTAAHGASAGLSRFTEIDWPKGLAPKAVSKLTRKPSDPLPRADVLMVTWTVDEGHALSRVFTPGKDSQDDYLPYTHNFAAFGKKMRAECPARQLGRLGTYWLSSLGGKKIVVFKSDSHMSQDGPQLPNIDLWRQLIEEVRPSLVITTGTAGGIGADLEVGDVVVSPVVRFECTAKFKDEAFAHAHYANVSAKRKFFRTARRLFKANADKLPKDNARPPKIFRIAPGDTGSSVLTTDFFGFDTSNNHYKLQGLGRAAEMGDAILGLVAAEMDNPPRWLAIRNVSDPQIKADGLTLSQQSAVAAQIYKAFGRWSSVCGAIACWAAIAAEM